MSRKRDLLARNNDPALIDGRLNVQDFVAARRAQIAKLQAALDGASGKQRAFQTLPRRRRRRTASHNPKRVPKRIRARAIQEMAEDKPKVKRQRKSRNKEGSTSGAAEDAATAEDESNPATAASSPGELVPNVLAVQVRAKRYAERQREHAWLPTHIWHRKRAKLEPCWGFQVPVTPTQKQYRLTHRLHDQLGGALIWDTSYFGTLVALGPRDQLVALVGKLAPDAAAALYLEGARAWQGMFARGGEPLGPALVHWREDGVLVNAHPAVFVQVFEHFTAGAVASALRVYDLRWRLGSVDVVGSKGLHAIAASLRSARVDGTAKRWAALGALANMDSLPFRAVIAHEVYDPRLFFPPKKQGVHMPRESLLSTTTAWPAPEGSLEQTFLRDSIDAATVMPADAEIAARKVPGEAITPLPTDARFPVSVFKLDDARVRVLLPRAYVPSFWHSLTHLPQAHIGGLAQFQQLAFERGVRHFPTDYPAAPAGRDFATKRAAAAEQKWNARQPAKRPSLAGEVGSPFGPDWALLPKPIADLVPVVVRVTGRGTPSHGARLYALPPDTENAWLAAAQGPESNLPCPDASFLIGFVTSGSYNLSEAAGTGVGYATTASGACLVRNIGSTTVRVATLEETARVVI